MSAPRRITLEIDSSSPPIHGRLHSDPDFDRQFTGWISLLAVLQEVLGEGDGGFADWQPGGGDAW